MPIPPPPQVMPTPKPKPGWVSHPKEAESATIAQEMVEAYEQGGQEALDNVTRWWEAQVAAKDASRERKEGRVLRMQQSISKTMRGIKGVR